MVWRKQMVIGLTLLVTGLGCGRESREYSEGSSGAGGENPGGAKPGSGLGAGCLRSRGPFFVSGLAAQAWCSRPREFLPEPSCGILGAVVPNQL